MPIFEFRCDECQDIFELLVLNQDETIELCCPKCKSNNFERVLSTTNFAVTNTAGGQSQAKAQTRTCSGGSCTTYEIPGCD